LSSRGSRLAAFFAKSDSGEHPLYGAAVEACGTREDRLDLGWEQPEVTEREIHSDWSTHLTAALEQAIRESVVTTKVYLATQQLESRVAALEKLVGRFISRQSFIVPVTTLAPYPFELKRDIPVLVQVEDDEFVASFVEANVGTSGETLNEAIDGLKEMLTMAFTQLQDLPNEKLGRGPRKQRLVLESFIESKVSSSGSYHEGTRTGDRT
jgi:hypothetical protein